MAEDPLDVAIRTAFEAGRLTLASFQAGIQAEYKADDTPVTAADRAAEELVRDRLHVAFPDDGIRGEEYEEERSKSGRSWWVDPIDGTKSFLRGVPLYAVLIALEVEGTVEVGAAYFPALDEMVYAARGRGAFLNGRRIHVARTSRLERAFVSCTDPGSFAKYGREEAWRRLQAASYARVGWGDAYGHALVASGRLELMLDPKMYPWDCGPFGVILAEAGGYFGDWSGRATIHGGEAISTTATLLPEVLALIRGEPSG
ncbi:MAG: inositol monophosphatase family protein [Deinococcales bacterium]